MADLELHIGGDSGEASAALHDAGSAAHEAHDSFHELKEKADELKESFTAGALAANAFEKAVEFAKDFVSESVQEYAKAEAAQRQLAFAAGDLTKEFTEQAEVIGRNLAVKAEDVEHMQTMLLRYGAAPEVIGNAIVAVQNFATATGQDANSAMMMLIRGVESGHGSLGRMGVKFEETGDKSKDFAAAIEALNKKFGGAAATEAEGLSGQMRAASIAVDEAKKSFGEFLAMLETKSHVLDVWSGFWRGGFGGMQAAVGQAIFGTGKTQEAVPGVEGQNPLAKDGGVDLDIGQVELSPSKKQLDKAEKNEEAYLEKYNKWLDEQWVAARKAEDDDEKAFDDYHDKRNKALMQAQDEEFKIKDEAAKAWLEQQKKLDEQELSEMKEQARLAQEQLKSQEKMWTSAGERIGTVLVEGMISMIQGKGGKGGGPDFAAQLAGAIMGIVGAAIPLFGGLVSFIQKGFGGDFSGATGLGNQAKGFFTAGSGPTPPPGYVAPTNYGASDPSEWENPFPTQHAGGWVRYHTGGWVGEVPMIGLAGERVLSQGEVSRMGGRDAVDSAARGGGTTMNVYAFDAQSLLDVFGGGSRGVASRAMLNAVRTNKGALREMFGGS